MFYYTLKAAVKENLTRVAFRGSRGREASGRGESSGVVCPTRKAAPGGARQGPKGHEADPRLARRQTGRPRPTDRTQKTRPLS